MALRSDSGWRAKLVESYPDLFHPAGDPLAAEGWPAVDDGWRELLERACARIRKAVSADGGSFRATQIKEKYGSLRFYWSGRLSPEARALVEEAIDLAEARSATTCEICGEQGRLHGGGWLAARCAVHAEGRPAVPVDDGFENLHVDRRVAGGPRLLRYRFYDRDADRFVEAGRPRRKGN
ncbi:hypothetical protein I6F18_18815 [Bradyrhizobium sp. NBAIM32]|uniref:hypothetical protein n=1 Tax=Bradyrhizobium sp. NBAIM32 TaxID=2793809 RepID=UPI001CD28850|nr:hypothetical protein [Bradyrhizobium sp. NBAIM32]MCA1542015.1 hypothetical protein [Bradyrhizobium sp. NBAIM32]